MSRSDLSVKSSGAVVFWSACDADRTAIKAALTNAGLPMNLLPGEVSTLEAMKAALTSLYGGKGGYRIEPLRGGRRGFGALSVTSDSARDIAGENALTCELWTAGAMSQIDVKFYSDSFDDTVERPRIHAAIERERGRVDSNAVSDLIANLCGMAAGVRLRDRGGIWWVPAARLDTFRQWRAALSAAVPGITIQLMTTQVDDDTVRAAVDSVRAEAVAITAEVQQRLVSGCSDTRALKHMTGRLEAMRHKLVEYELSLDTALPEIKAAVANCETATLLAQMGDFDAGKFAF
jgi:hypothetical protein